MTVYVESNFVLEIALLQEQARSCTELLELAKTKQISVVLPAFCIAEPYQTLIRRQRERKSLSDSINTELGQLGRSEPYREPAATLRDVGQLLIRSIEEERARFQATLEKVLAYASLIPLNAHTLAVAVEAERDHGFSPQDSIVYASVIEHLRGRKDGASCFMNRNSRDFDDPDIVSELDRNGCKMIPRFDAGMSYIRSVLKEGEDQ
jgi:hypothetical protein